MATTAGTQSTLVKEVLKVEAERVRAICEQDWPALEAVLADDLSYVHMPGNLEDKATFLAGYKNRPRKTERHDLKVRIYGDSTAVVTGIMMNTRPDGGTPSRAMVTQTWVKDGAGWKMASFQASRIQEGGER